MSGDSSPPEARLLNKKQAVCHPAPHGNPGRFCACSPAESSQRQTFLLKSGSLSSAQLGHLSGWKEASICSNFCWFAATVFAGPVSLTKMFPPLAVTIAPSRSEEHTSELQSLRHLVCRLLL